MTEEKPKVKMPKRKTILVTVSIFATLLIAAAVLRSFDYFQAAVLPVSTVIVPKNLLDYKTANFDSAVYNATANTYSLGTGNIDKDYVASNNVIGKATEVFFNNAAVKKLNYSYTSKKTFWLGLKGTNETDRYLTTTNPKLKVTYSNGTFDILDYKPVTDGSPANSGFIIEYSGRSSTIYDLRVGRGMMSGDPTRSIVGFDVSKLRAPASSAKLLVNWEGTYTSLDKYHLVVLKDTEDTYTSSIPQDSPVLMSLWNSIGTTNIPPVPFNIGYANHGTVSFAYDSFIAGSKWNATSWRQVSLPVGTSIAVRQRASDTFPIPVTTPWATVSTIGGAPQFTDQATTVRPVGRYAQLQFILDTTVANVTPKFNTPAMTFSFDRNAPISTTWVGTTEISAPFFTYAGDMTSKRELMPPAADALNKWAAEYKAKYGKLFPVESLFRGADQQCALYLDWIQGRSPIEAARPCSSRHESALAIDMDLSKVNQADYKNVVSMGAKYGWKCLEPVWLSGEDHHFDYIPGIITHFSDNDTAAINAASGGFCTIPADCQ
jgi:hypothetical protein